MLSPKLFTEFLQDISASFDQDQGIAVDTLLVVYMLFADDLVLFFRICRGITKTADCPVFIYFPMAYHSKHS